MTDDSRLLIDLEVLRVALGAYLSRLTSLWSRGNGGRSDEVEQLLVAAGTAAIPTDGEREVMAELLNATASGALARVVDALRLTRAEELLVAAAWWSESDPQIATVFGCAHDDGARRYASPGIIRLLLEPFGLHVPPVIDADSALVRCGVLDSAAETSSPLRLTPTARLVLLGKSPTPFAPARRAPARLADVRNALERRLREGAKGVVALRGPAGVGRRAIAAEAAAACGRIPVSGDLPGTELRLLARLDLALPIVPAERLAELGWQRDDPLLVAWAAQGERAPGAYVVELRSPNRKQRTQAWADALERIDVDTALAPLLAARFNFAEGDIADVVERAERDADWRGERLDDHAVWEAARRQPEHELARLASLITPAFTLADLVLTEKAQEQLRELVVHVALQHVVLDDWGFRTRLPRGQGVAALFAGPPGTGKTMAAEAVADALSQDLYRIDLSAVVSKYIGETEKNLSAAFDEAERAGAVLFFDEADALFGKRTEVRDAHDRYANLEVNYLLQRVETFTGLVILASNRQSAMDEAFLRRLRFSIRFDVPDYALRLELWRRAFPPEAAIGDLDWDALAEGELAGGTIQAAALAAAYLAASDGGVITNERVERALEREYDKLGRAWTGLRLGAAA